MRVNKEKKIKTRSIIVIISYLVLLMWYIVFFHYFIDWGKLGLNEFKELAQHSFYTFSTILMMYLGYRAFRKLIEIESEEN